MADRQKTNSITHLVKVVAEEVVEEKMGPRLDATEKKFNNLFNRIERVEAELGIVDADDSIDNAPDFWQTPNAGDTWGREQSEMFIENLEKAIRWIACKQGRTVGSIKARINQVLKNRC